MAFISLAFGSSRPTTITINRNIGTPASSSYSCNTLLSSISAYVTSSAASSGIPITDSVWDTDSGATLVASSVSNYFFDGWYTTESDVSGSPPALPSATVKIESSRTISADTIFSLAKTWSQGDIAHKILYAKYVAPYVITWDGNGGTPSQDTRNIRPGTALGDLPTATRQGYTFVGWFTATEGGTQVTSSTVPDASTTYHAQWEGDYVTAIFDPNGGYITASSLTRQVKVGREFSIVGDDDNPTFITLPTPSHDRAVFVGWFTEKVGGTQIDDSTIVPGVISSITVYAHWDFSDSLILSFNPNGGTVSPYYKELHEGDPYGTLPTPSYGAFTFLGWFTEPTGGVQVSDSTIMGNESVTIYAHWDAHMVNNVFRGNGGTPSTQVIYYAEGLPFGSLPSVERTGFTFLGWRTTSGSTWITAATIVSSRSRDFSAQWAPATTEENLIWNLYHDPSPQDFLLN